MAVVRFRAQPPVGAKLQCDVLLLGEEHLRPTGRRLKSAVPLQQLIKAATHRAAYGASPTCLDIFFEETEARGVVTSTGERERRDDVQMGVDTCLEELRHNLRGCFPHARAAQLVYQHDCPLGSVNIRVHATDTRAVIPACVASASLLSAAQRMILQNGEYLVPLPTKPQTRRTQELRTWLSFFVGLGPKEGIGSDDTPRLSAAHMQTLRNHVFNGNTAAYNAWYDQHKRFAARVRQRARAFGPANSRWLFDAVVKVAARNEELDWEDLMACAVDFYTLIRMFAPFPPRSDRGSPCPPDVRGSTRPRCCLFFGGWAHVEWMYRVMETLAHERWPRLESAHQNFCYPLSKATVVGFKRPRTVDGLLKTLGLK
jgi:hypothetical protein